MRTFKLLSVLCLLWTMGIVASANHPKDYSDSQWEEPTKPEVPTTAGEFVVGHNYYVRLAANGQYLTGGNSWSTKLSITDNGFKSLCEPIIVTIDSLTTMLGGVEVKGLCMKLNGKFTFSGAMGTRSMANTMLFRVDETQAFVDYFGQGMGSVWNFTKVGNYYRIQTAADDPAFPDAATQYIGWDSTGSEYVEGSGWNISQTVVMCNIAPETEGFDTYYYDWELIPADGYLSAKKCYDIRVSLYNKLVAAKQLIESGATLNIGKYSDVYNNSTSTYEELSAAIDELSLLLAYANLPNASKDNPTDATCFIKNNKFDLKNEGWTDTYITGVSANNHGYLSEDINRIFYENGEVWIHHFTEAWSNADYAGIGKRSLRDGSISQTLPTLPPGRWKLSCDAIAVNQDDDKTPCEGAQLFANGAGMDYFVEMHTANEKPEHFELDFVSTGAEFTIGFRSNNTTANWIATDNYTLTYYGDNTIDFADSNVKALCVANWDTNGDGELSESEAASVRDLGDVFKNDSTITSFDELQYFTGLTSIGEWAFEKCSSMQSIMLPNSITSIGRDAFNNCSSLTSFIIPSSITRIEQGTFYECRNLKSVVVPNSVTGIYNGAFCRCHSLDSIEIPNSVTYIDDWWVFADCWSLKSIAIPNSVTRIGGYAFYGCSSLTSITIPNSVTSIGEHAFDRCGSLTSITIPNSVTSIENHAFNYCSSLSSIILPSNLSVITEGLFDTCSALSSITIQNNVTNIDVYAFYRCSSLTSITIPNSVTSIGVCAFEDCTSLTDMTVKWSNPSMVSLGNGMFNNVDLTNATLHVPAGTKALYEAADVWKDFGKIVEQYSHDADNIIYAADVTGRLDARTVQVPLYLNNSVSMCAAEFYLTLPEGISIKQEFDEEEEEYVWGIEKGGRLRGEHGISCKQEADGDYHFICSDLISNKNFFDSQDRKGLPFMTLTLVFDENLANGDYEMMIHDLILNHNGEESIDEYKADEIPSTLSLPKKQQLSVSSNDETFGTASFVAATYDETYGDVTYGDNVTLTANPSQNYKFVRWTNGGEELSTENPLTLSVVSDMSIVAEFVLSQVTVTFNVDGTEYSSGLQTCGSKLTLPDAPTKTGYTFRGWTNVTDDTVVPNQDVTYEAVFDINRYQVAFLDYNGTPIYQQSQDWGSEITAPADPVREDWFFLGWSPEVDATVPMNDVTYTAQYTLRGDVTGDNVRNVTDLTTLVNIILNKSQVDARTFTAANVHVDNVLNITDLTSIVNLILNVGSGAQKVKPTFGESRAFLSMDDVNAMAGFNATLSIKLNSNDEDITAGQFDLVLPEGVSLASVKASERLASSHVVGAQTQEDGTVRVLFFSMRNDVAKSEEGSVIDIELCVDGNLLDGQYDIMMKDAVLTTPDERSSRKDMTTARINVGNATSIDGVNGSQSMKDGDAYNLSGQPVGESHKGVIIKDGKKVYNK